MNKTVRMTGGEVTEEDVARRAYEIWQARGCPEGTGEADWQAAEAELLAENAPPRRGPLVRLLNRFRGKAASW